MTSPRPHYHRGDGTLTLQNLALALAGKPLAQRPMIKLHPNWPWRMLIDSAGDLHMGRSEFEALRQEFGELLEHVGQFEHDIQLFRLVVQPHHLQAAVAAQQPSGTLRDVRSSLPSFTRNLAEVPS